MSIKLAVASIIVAAFLIAILRKGDKDMAVIYATLIIKGYKTYAQVPDRLKAQVKEVLIALEMPELAE